MNKVTVKRVDLLDRIKKNRESHRALFLKAQEGYRVCVIQELDQMLQEARDGKPIRRAIELAEPQDHTTDYDRVIDMLEMSMVDAIDISSHEFASYVRDEWAWKAHAQVLNSTFASGSAMYVGEDGHTTYTKKT